MKRAKVLTAIFALVALAACNEGGLPPGGTYQSFTGLVVDSATNQPVSGAIVTVDTVLTATTDNTGKFTFDRVPVGDIDYQVSVPKGNFKPYTSSAHLESDKPLSVTISLPH
jgi:Carboxypeptidase regulatory-like domain